MSHKKILDYIQNEQLKTFSTWDKFSTKSLGEAMGLYWIWTKIPIEDLQKIPVANPANNSEVNISKLAKERSDLKNIFNNPRDGYTVVYNGKGILKYRINQEFNNSSEGTGTLSLAKREGFNSKDWAVSFFDFNDEKHKKALDSLSFSDATDLERNWRIEFGIPILSRN